MTRTALFGRKEPALKSNGCRNGCSIGERAADVPETGCLICGAPLVYPAGLQEKACSRCGVVKSANAVCGKGHFVCDACHAQDPKEIIRKVCTTTRETDMIRLLRHVRSHDRIPMHGPEYHILVPAVILATYGNLGGRITEKDILAGIERGSAVPGGACGFMGVCGAAVGVGIAFSILLGSNPLEPELRQKVQRIVAEVTRVLAERKAARCCHRECFLALREAARLSEGLLPISLRADEASPCEQYQANTECIGVSCPLFPRKPKTSS